MKKRNRRGIPEFSVSFLDVICCGVGAIILLLMITKTVEPIVLEKSQVNLEGVVADRENALFEIKGQVRELRTQVSDADADLTENMQALARLEKEHVPASPINSVGEAFDDPQVAERGLKIQPQGIPGVRTPIMFGSAPMAAKRTAPKLGEHDDFIRSHGWDVVGFPSKKETSSE